MTGGRQIGGSRGGVWTPSQAAIESEELAPTREWKDASDTGRSSASQQVTDALLQVIAEQNPALDEHVERVSDFTSAVAHAFGEPEQEVWRIHLAARLHDIGKTAIPAAILDKPGPLDEREWDLMRLHPLIGERIAMAAPVLAGAAPLIRSSHEWINGGGYPDGLTGEDIPLGARIIAVCDAFDAMTSERCYRQATSPQEALDELRRSAGSQFDPEVVLVFGTTLRLPAAGTWHAGGAARHWHRRRG
jgi:two-component system, cell cycle response regulator